MDWVPDPIDAGSNHKFNKSEDVLSYILGLFDQEDFIKEVTNVLAQHLLPATDPEFARETRLVELFKSRFDASKLQAAEVMLKDMRDSVMLQKRILPARGQKSVPTPRDIQAAVPDEGITLRSLHQQFENRMTQSQFLATVKLTTNRRGDLYFPKRGRLPSAAKESAAERDESNGPDISFRILSSFFWPQLRSNKFALPSTFTNDLAHIDSKFAHYSGQRRLEWQHALGRMSITLELEDRKHEEVDIPAWRVSVINAFSSDEGDDATTLTASQLEDILQMDAELVSDALSFWSNKRVLYQPTPAEYAVLERLDMDVAPTAPAAAEEEAFSAVKSQDAVLRENAPMFEIFIANMLRNSGAKEVGGMMGIANMLKMVLPTFTYGEEEVLFLLGEMESRGEVTRDGESWKIAK
jgi:anaphase-promoting complex subunit 2